MTRYVLFYTPALGPDLERLIGEHFPAHQARYEAFHAEGRLLGIGTFGDPRQGAMALFPSREDAEAFVAEDPFVLHGVVAERELREWDDVLAG